MSRLDPLGDERVGGDDAAQEARLLRLEHLAQATVGIGAVAHEGQALDLDHLALGDVEHEIDAVVGAADDLRRDGGRDPALHPVGFGDGGGVGLGLGGIVGPPRLRLHQPGQLVVLDAGVAFEVDDIDRGEFLHPDHEGAALRHDLDRLEQARVRETLVGLVQLARRDGLPPVDPREAEDGRGIDPFVALDPDVGEGVVLGQRRQGHARCDACHAKEDRHGRRPDHATVLPCPSVPRPVPRHSPALGHFLSALTTGHGGFCQKRRHPASLSGGR